MEHNKNEILEVLQYVNSLGVDDQYISILKQLVNAGINKRARGHSSVCAATYWPRSHLSACLFFAARLCSLSLCCVNFSGSSWA